MPFFGQEIFEQAQAKGPLTDAAYIKAKADAKRLAGTEGLLAALDGQKLDALIAPSMAPTWPTDHVLGDHVVGAGYGMAAVAGTPSLTVPMGETLGLPLGLAFMGRAYSEAELLAFGYAFEQRTKARRAPQFKPTLGRVAPAARRGHNSTELSGGPSDDVHSYIHPYRSRRGVSTSLAFAQTPATASRRPKSPAEANLAGLKRGVAEHVDGLAKLAQEAVDSVFSFGELGFQEVETSKYLTGVLEKNGFKITRGQSGIPTAWVATFGSGKPVIALGSDIDGIPQSSQKPGVAYKDPIVEGAPGHGEGHNTGVPLNIVAAIAVKRVMEREKLPGTLMLWPGVAEELVASKAWFIRDGMFKDVDVTLFTHVGNNLNVSWGAGGGNGLVSVEYTFEGETAHSAGAPWRGRSAADAVELMSVGWNYRREHLRLSQRSHSVITNGGDQPNVVPRNASIWFYFRETDQPHIQELWDIGNKMAEGAALMTNTTWTSRILGTA